MQLFKALRAGCLVTGLAVLNLSVASNAALSADAAAASNGGPRTINVTSDSMPGWLPSAELERQVRATAVDYLEDMDSGKYEQAYGFLADIDKKDQPFSDFSSRIRQFNERAGSVIERRIVTITWTENPARTPFPGTYAALDLVSRFSNIDRHCGYLVLFQAPSGGPIQVMREESNFMDNAAAARIAREHSLAEVDSVWANLSARCPGYKASLAAPVQPVPPPPLPEVASDSTGYPTVEAALTALHAKTGVVFTTENGWTVATDAAAMTIWSFPPQSNPAFPAAVKRQIVERNGTTNIDMSVRCEASKSACDDLVRSFEQLNANMAAGLRQHN